MRGFSSTAVGTGGRRRRSAGALRGIAPDGDETTGNPDGAGTAATAPRAASSVQSISREMPARPNGQSRCDRTRDIQGRGDRYTRRNTAATERRFPRLRQTTVTGTTCVAGRPLHAKPHCLAPAGFHDANAATANRGAQQLNAVAGQEFPRPDSRQRRCARHVQLSGYAAQPTLVGEERTGIPRTNLL
jgi:hypothetical protein